MFKKFNVNVTRIPGLDASKYDAILEVLVKKYPKHVAYTHALATSLSQYSIWKMAKAKQQERILILEDDVYFHEDINEYKFWEIPSGMYYILAEMLDFKILLGMI